jgi:hypothetical protein
MAIRADDLRQRLAGGQAPGQAGRTRLCDDLNGRFDQ